MHNPKEQLRKIAFMGIKVINYLKATLHHYVYTGQYTTNRNYGDALGYWLPVLLRVNRGRILPKRKIFGHQYKQGVNLQMVGSTLADVNEHSILCGAGAVSEQQGVSAPPKKVLSVRGPLTRDILLKQGIDCPPVYGDPAMLMPLFYTPKRRKVKYRIGLIPHYVDKETAGVKQLLQCSDVHLIDILLPPNGLIRTSIEQYWKEWIDELCSCSVIVSSSLHGLILAEAYGIPTVWAEFSDKVNGKGFKFKDYYASINTPPHLLSLINNQYSIEQIIMQATRKDVSVIDREGYRVYLKSEIERILSEKSR